MSEHEIRTIISTACAHLDRHARSLGRGLRRVAAPASVRSRLILFSQEGPWLSHRRQPRPIAEVAGTASTREPARKWVSGLR